jgi:predicted DNA-binding protein (MmcQ/YjbR family)
MVTSATVREQALEFEDTTEEPHFEKTSFRVKNKIFATLDESKHQLVLKLSEVYQSVFSAYDDSIIYPVWRLGQERLD